MVVLYSHRDTYLEREAGESNNDRNDRAIRFACNWYDGHMMDAQTKSSFGRCQSDVESSTTRVILLTDDEANYQQAKKEGILVAHTEEYVASLLDYPMLIDKIAHKNSKEGQDKDKEEKEDKEKVVPPASSISFPCHLSMSEIMEGIRGRRLLQGQFQASRENYLEGSVSVEGYEHPVGIWRDYETTVN